MRNRPPILNPVGHQLMGLARTHGNHWFDADQRLCVGPRDTLWYAIALLHAEDVSEQKLGDQLLAEARGGDGTHTPATMLAILHCIPDRISAATRKHLENTIQALLPEAMLAEWHDGNVNHPLAAWASLILAGERFGDRTALQSGAGRLRSFARTVGDRRYREHRQAVFSEYNSPTYTALNLWFLALIAEYAHTAEMRDLARFLEERLWMEVGLFYHAPSGQFSGPHSRAYLDDSLGGWSALHCTLAIALNEPLLLTPERALQTDHPSAILENALVAILRFHLPAAARDLLFHKPLPCEIRAMTYGESYHENDVDHGFRGRVYPGGWSQLTSWQTEHFAIGSAERPYVNAGHADAFSIRIRRRDPVRALSDFRSLFCRGVFNEAMVGQSNPVHVTGGRTDASYLYEEGRTCTLQHRNRVLVQYHPKEAASSDFSAFRVDILFSWDAPFDEFLVNGAPHPGWEGTFRADSRFLFRDGEVLGLLLPLPPAPAVGEQALTMREVNGCLVISSNNGPGRGADRDASELCGWCNGFYCEIWTTETFADLTALDRHAQSIAVSDLPPGQGRLRQTVVQSAEVRLELVQDPWAEVVHRATVNGEDRTLFHFEAHGGADGQPLLEPLSLYGREAWEAFQSTPNSGS